MDNARVRTMRTVQTTTDQPGSKMGAATFIVFCLCLIALMVMGTIKLGMVLFG